MVEATTEFRKNGFNDEDAAQLGLIASMYQNVSDEAISAGDSASFIIAQLTAFGDTMSGFTSEAEKAQHVIDAVNEVANNFSVSSADLANNLGNASAALAVGNNSFEELLGLLTAGTEVTRSANKVARALVSVQSRLNQVVDESSSTGAALTAWYKEHNIAIYDQEGQLRSLFDVLKDTAAIWPSLTKNEQAYYLNQQAGAHQTQNLASILSNFNSALEATETAYNAAGSAAQENARVLESLNAKVSSVKANFQELSNNVIESDLIKAILDLVNKALDLLDTKVGRLIVQWALLSGVLTGGISIFGNIGSKLVGMASNITNIIGSFTKLGSAFSTAAQGGTGLVSSISLISKAAGPVAAGIGAIAVASYGLYSYFKDTIVTSEELAEKEKELGSSIEDVSNQIKTNQDRLEEINGIPWFDRTEDILKETEALKTQNEELEKQLELLQRQREEVLDSPLYTDNSLIADAYSYYLPFLHGGGLATGVAGEDYDPTELYTNNAVARELLLGYIQPYEEEFRQWMNDFDTELQDFTIKEMSEFLRTVSDIDFQPLISYKPLGEFLSVDEFTSTYKDAIQTIANELEQNDALSAETQQLYNDFLNLNDIYEDLEDSMAGLAPWE